MFVKPKKGETILDPATGKDLPAGGAEVRETPYWKRMERRGAVSCTRTAADAEVARAAAARSARKPVDIPGRGKVAGSLTVGKKKG